jgi:hypothetical protein
MKFDKLVEAYLRVVNEDIDAEVTAALDAGQDPEVLFTKVATKYGTDMALNIIRELLDAGVDSHDMEIQLKNVYNKLMKGHNPSTLDTRPPAGYYK